MRQSNRVDGQRRGSVKEFSLDEVKVNLISVAGYIKYKPLGVSYLCLRIRPVKLHERLPPAESPATYKDFGRILINL